MTTTIVLSVVAVGVFVLLDFGLSVAVSASGALSRVALRRIANDDDGAERFSFLEELESPGSSHRVGAHLVRQGLVLATVAVGTVALDAVLDPVGLAAAAAVAATAVVAVLGIETLAARAIALRNPKAALRRTAFLLRFARVVTAPVAVPAARFIGAMEEARERAGEERDEDQDEDVEALIEVGEREGIFEADEGKMMRSIVDLGDTRVREIMTPRPDIDALPIETTIGEARRGLDDVARSKIPVYRDSIDNIIGILHLRDLVRAWGAERDDAPITPYVRPALFVPETQAVDDLLHELRTRTNVALVVDEYGGIAGLVTLEDVLEEIVGDIRDEHDSEEEHVREESEGVWSMSGLVHVDVLEDMFDLEIEERDFDTVGGLVVAELGRVPGEGEVLEYRGLRMIVTKADPRRVYTLRVEAPARAEIADAGDEGLEETS